MKKNNQWLYFTDEDIESKFDLVKKILLDEIDMVKNISIESPEQLKILIDSYKEILSNDESEPFFKSKEHRIAYHLINIDRTQNEIYKEELEITRVLYKDKNLAGKWKRKMSLLFHSDHFSYNFDANEVMAAVNKIYKRLVGEA